jgi:hypothetical protein
MLVADLFEDEEDLPLIYDIIKAKLAAGQVIIIKDLNSKLLELTYNPNWLNPIEAVYEKDGKQAVFGTTPTRLEFKWKLTKKDDHWELET